MAATHIEMINFITDVQRHPLTPPVSPCRHGAHYVARLFERAINSVFTLNFGLKVILIQRHWLTQTQQK